MPFKMVDITGHVYGRLTVLRFDRMERRGPKSTHALWLCRCECGREVAIPSSWLRTGNTKSCGCAKAAMVSAAIKRHGFSPYGKRKSIPVYHVWCAMRMRCSNPNNPDFHRYGGRGIKVCERWNQFENFLADMGEPEPGMSIDRKNTNGNYEPGNCRWATVYEQARNKRWTKMLTARGKTQCIQDWAREVGVSHQRIRKRVASGWSHEQAIFSPYRQKDAIG